MHCRPTRRVGTDAVKVDVPDVSTAPAGLSYTWVSYNDYLTRASVVGIRSDALVSADEFTSSLAALCDNSVSDFTSQDRAHRAAADAAAASAGVSADQADRWMTDEMTLRIGMACPDRLQDWSTGRTGIG